MYVLMKKISVVGQKKGQEERREEKILFLSLQKQHPGKNV